MASGLGNIKLGIDEPFFLKTIENAAARQNAQFAQKHQLKLGVDGKAFSRSLGQITGNVKDFESSLAASNARVIAFGASTAVIGGIIRSFQELANATIEVEKSMIDVNRVFGLTSSGLQKLTSDLFEVSKVTASSFKDSSKALLEFSRQGVSATDALQRTRDALTLTRLAGVSTESAVESLTATVNGFSNAGLNTTQILNKLVAVEQDYAVGAGDLSEALSRTGQAAQEAGVNLDQLNALVTSAQQNTARGGAVIGNALKTIFTRLQRAETLDQLDSFNVAVRDIEGNVLPATQILKSFAEVYKTLGTSQKSQLSEQIAGVYQVNILKALIKDLNSENSIYNNALETGANATNEAEIATAKLNSTMAALFSRVGTGTTQLASNIGNVTFEPLARSAATSIESIINTLNSALEGDGAGSVFANGLLKGIRNVLSGPAAVGVFAVLYKIGATSFNYLAEIAPKLIGITTETSKRKALEEQILLSMQQQGGLANAILGAQGNQAAQVAIIANEARLLTQEYQKQVALSKQLAPILVKQGVSVGKRGYETTRSGGFIPDSVRNAEIQGAFQGGYIPGKVIKSPVGGVMNSAETVKYFAGFSQPFINPPANSKAGMKHKEASMRQTGINPYSSDGFLPNFANPKFVQNIIGSYKASLTEKDSIRSAQAQKAQNYYPIVNSELKNLSSSSGYSLEKLAYSLAALSGNTSDSDARKGLERIVKNEPYDDLAILPKNVEKVRKMLDSSGSSEELMSILGKGAKTQNFAPSLLLSEKFSGFGKYKNPLGTPSVMDSWAIYVRNGGALKDKYDRKAVADKQKRKLFSQSASGYKYYNTLVKEYGEASQILGIPVRDLQARTWGWARGQVGSVTRNSFDSGFIPNFAYKDSVMGLEQSLSGNKAIYSDNPFPHVRNSSQPTFNSAIADHGGLNNALNDSILGQKSFGLLNSGFVPNFADATKNKFNLTGVELRNQSGQFVNREKLAQSVEDYIRSIDLVTTSNLKLNPAIQTILKKYNLKKESFDAVRKASLEFAKKEREAAIALESLPPKIANLSSLKVPPVLRKDLQEQGLGKTDSKKKGGINPNTGLSLAFGIPLISGIVEQYIYGKAKREDMSQKERFGQSLLSAGSTSISTGALVGGSIGGAPGALIGAAAGSLLALGTAAKATKLSLEEMSNKIEESTAKQIGVVKDYSLIMEQFNNAQASGDTRKADLARKDLETLLLSPEGKSLSGRLQMSPGGSDLEKIISEISSKAASQRGFVAVAETMKSDGSFFSDFNQKAREAILNFTDIVLDGFVYIKDSSVAVFNTLAKTIQDPFAQVISIVARSFTNLITFISSSFELAILKIKDDFLNIYELFPQVFGTDTSKQDKESRLDAIGKASKAVFDSFGGLTDAITDGVSLGFTKAYPILFPKPFREFASDIFATDSKRKGGGFSPDALAEDYIKAGGLKTIDFLNSIVPQKPAYAKGEEFLSSSIFGKSDAIRKQEKQGLQNEQIYSILGTIGSSEHSKERGAQMDVLTDMLLNRGLDKAQIEAFMQLVEKFSETGNKKGQAILMNFSSFMTAINESVTTASNVAAERLSLQGSFVKIKRDIEKSVSDYINQSKVNEAKIVGSFDRQKLAFGERQRMSEELGKPEEAAYSRFQSSIETINFETQKNVRDEINKTFEIVNDINNALTPESRPKLASLQENLSKEDYSLEQRLDLLSQFSNLQNVSYADPGQKREIEKKIEASRSIIEETRVSNEESKQTALEIYKLELKRVDQSRSFTAGLKAGFSSLQYEADTLLNKLGRQLPSAFADGMANAITLAITGAKNIGDALKDAAISFGQQIISDLLRASLYKTISATGVGALFGAKQKGGVITAQNGMYISGGRTGDKNMALLEDGEYVLNRNAVKAAGGKGVLDQFNFKQAPRFATGGGFGTQAEMKYLRPKGKDEGYDFTDTLLSGNSSQSINADNYSAYAYENDQYFVKKREQAVQDLAEKVQRDFVKKQKNAALISSIVGAVGAMSLSAGISQIGQQAALGSQAAQAAKSGSLIGTTPAAQKAISSLSDRQLGRFISNNSSDFRLNGLGLNFSAGTSNGFLGLSKLSNLSQPLTKAGFTSLKGSGFSLFNQGVSEGVGLSRRGRQDGGLIGLNGGGYLPHGSRLGDTIPALLTGGEYVMNNSAVKKYGIGKMNEMNNGSMNENSSSTTSNTNNNSANISISIDRSGKSVVGATNSSYEKQDLILTKDMARSIHAVVLKTMSNEKRYGGELYKNPLRS